MRVRARRWCAAAFAAAAFALAALAPGRACAGGRRVLFVASASTPFSARVRAEIEAMGFEIVPAADLAEGSKAGAVAAARVLDDPGHRVELWVLDASTGHLALRAVVVPSPDEDDASETVRASEELRAFFQPLRAPGPPHLAPVPAPPQPPPPAPEPIPPPAPFVPAPEPAPPPPPERTRFVVGADLAIPFQPGGPGLDLGLRGRWMATQVLGLGAFVRVPLAGSTVTASEGSASVSVPLFGADLTASAEPVSWLRLSASAGLALAWVRTSGFATPPFQGQPSNVAVALALAGAGIAPRITDRLHLCFDGQAGVSLPKADIAFAGHTVATWGRPLGLLSAGVGVDL
jgi:hypothetical protein